MSETEYELGTKLSPPAVTATGGFRPSATHVFPGTRQSKDNPEDSFIPAKLCRHTCNVKPDYFKAT